MSSSEYDTVKSAPTQQRQHHQQATLSADYDYPDYEPDHQPPRPAIRYRTQKNLLKINQEELLATAQRITGRSFDRQSSSGSSSRSTPSDELGASETTRVAGQKYLNTNYPGETLSGTNLSTAFHPLDDKQANRRLLGLGPSISTNEVSTSNTNPQQQVAQYHQSGLNNLNGAINSDIAMSKVLAPDSQKPLSMDVENSKVSIRGSQSEPQLTSPQTEDRPYPRHVFFIVANEFCERFSYYGLRTVLVLYFTKVLGFTDPNAAISFHAFAALCYFTPVLGAILGDSIWGKYKTIFYLSIVYLLGELILLTSSVFWNYGLISVLSTFAGLILIGIGTGGIKPCVCTLGGDQFLPHEEKRRQAFFSLFYAAINLGSLISTFLTPLLRSNFSCVNRTDCYPYAFGVPCALMFVAIVVFLVARNQYHLEPLPERNVIVAFCQCVGLAIRRKLSGHPMPSLDRKSANLEQSFQSSLGDTSSSNLSVSSHDDQLTRSSAPANNPFEGVDLKPSRAFNSQKDLIEPENPRRPQSKYWLYVTRDRFDRKSIEDFRSVLAILLLFVPLPVYWCLYDQQGSLWTLQGTRMDGHVFGTGFVLQPDQMTVANPLLMIIAIPLFEVGIYPALGRHNLLTKPLTRMTVGGIVTTLAFVSSALIEFRIQQFQPLQVPRAGHNEFLIINGLSECTLSSPVLSSATIQMASAPPTNSDQLLMGLDFSSAQVKHSNPQFIGNLEPLGSQPVIVKSIDVGQPSVNGNSSENKPMVESSYQFRFQLTDQGSNSPTSGSSYLIPAQSPTQSCPYDANVIHEFYIKPPPNGSVRMLYIEQGNGKLSYKLLNESLQLPPPGKARVRVLFESFGSASESDKRKFYLVGATSRDISTFENFTRNGQVLTSGYLDVQVPNNGQMFQLKTSDGLIGGLPGTNHSILLKPGTRNLIVINQRDSKSVGIRNALLQDNNYQISLLYQLIPYTLISVGEVMFSITGLELCYTLAPTTMRSIIMASWNLTTAFGNLLTIFVESLHLFANPAHDFLFYATLMVGDMIVFALIGYFFKPNKRS